ARARDGLHAPVDGDGATERGGYRGTTHETSFYTQASMHPRTAALTLAGMGLVVAAGMRAWARRE
ncbi:MAG TPA: hypothetical protein VF048_05550, partial [Gemmatimonadaceae bacterium]